MSFCLFHSQSKPGQVRGKKGQDGEVQLEEEDASTPEQVEKQSEDSSRQFDAHSHEQVSGNRLIGLYVLFVWESYISVTYRC